MQDNTDDDDVVMKYIKLHVDLGDVRSQDTGYVRNVLHGVLKMDPLHPSFRVKVRRIGSHYHVLIKGWQSRIPLKKFSVTLCDDNKRHAIYNCVRQDVAVIPEDNGGPALVMRINQDNLAAVAPTMGREEALARAQKLVALRAKKRTFECRDNVNDDEVDVQDREYVHEILKDLFLWDDELPLVKVLITKRDAVYTCLISGWTREIVIREFSEHFIDEAHRGSTYDAVLQDAEVIPAHPDEGGPYLAVRIHRGFRSARSTRKR